MYVIDKNGCIGCGACEGTCPVSAISADADGKYTSFLNHCQHWFLKVFYF